MAGPAKPPVAIRITRPYGSEEEFLAKELDTLSRSGVTLVGAQARPEGVVLRFEIALATGAPILRGEGRVVGYKPNALGAEPGLALRFTRLDSKSKALIDRAAAMRDQRSGRVSVAPPPPPTPAPAPPPEPSVPAAADSAPLSLAPLPPDSAPAAPASATALAYAPTEARIEVPPMSEASPPPASAPPPAAHDEAPPSLRVTGEEEAPPSLVMAVEEEARAMEAQRNLANEAAAAAAAGPAPSVVTGPSDLAKLRERVRALTGDRITALLEEGRKLRGEKR